MVIAYLVVIGLCLGSFINAYVWRTYRQAELLDKKKLNSVDKRQLRELSITKGRSRCMACGKPLAAKDLVPVLSWLSLRGKCRYCKAKIPDTPLAEITVPVLLVLSNALWPYALTDVLSWCLFVVWGVALVLMVALAIYDLKWMLLPDRMVIPFTALSVAYAVLLAIYQQNTLIVGYSLISGAIFFAFFYALHALSDGKWIGGGDVKMAFALGVFAGTPVGVFLIMFIASLFGMFAAVGYVVQGKNVRGLKIPFGPFLLAATFIVVLVGGSLADWYFGLLTI